MISFFDNEFFDNNINSFFSFCSKYIFSRDRNLFKNVNLKIEVKIAMVNNSISVQKYARSKIFTKEENKIINRFMKDKNKKSGNKNKRKENKNENKTKNKNKNKNENRNKESKYLSECLNSEIKFYNCKLSENIPIKIQNIVLNKTIKEIKMIKEEIRLICLINGKNKINELKIENNLDLICSQLEKIKKMLFRV